MLGGRGGVLEKVGVVGRVWRDINEVAELIDRGLSRNWKI